MLSCCRENVYIYFGLRVHEGQKFYRISAFQYNIQGKYNIRQNGLLLHGIYRDNTLYTLISSINRERAHKVLEKSRDNPRNPAIQKLRSTFPPSGIAESQIHNCCCWETNTSCQDQVQFDPLSRSEHPRRSCEIVFLSSRSISASHDDVPPLRLRGLDGCPPPIPPVFPIAPVVFLPIIFAIEQVITRRWA